jgi:hypothetical protein
MQLIQQRHQHIYHHTNSRHTSKGDKLSTNKMINNINDMMNTITMIHFYQQSRKQHLLITTNQNNNNTMITIMNNNRMNT